VGSVQYGLVRFILAMLLVICPVHLSILNAKKNPHSIERGFLSTL
jgi:hypothetical protein